MSHLYQVKSGVILKKQKFFSYLSMLTVFSVIFPELFLTDHNRAIICQSVKSLESIKISKNFSGSTNQIVLKRKYLKNNILINFN